MILITGATGFIGKELVKEFDNRSIHILSRKPNDIFTTLNYSLEDFLVKQCLTDKYDVAIHLAGLAHDNYDLVELRKVNVEATIALAKQLAEKGLKRFIFVSSIGVNGNKTIDSAFSELSTPSPQADYALSKYEAEIELAKLSKELNFELVIIRPPLVYGINAPGNFKRLYKLASRGIPLPFGLAENSRSLVSVRNLCSLITLCTTHPKAAGELFLVSDDGYISTKKLIQIIWNAERTRSFLFPLPVFIFKMLLKTIGRSSISIQLFDDLQVDNSKAKKLLGWHPKQSIADVFKQP